MSMTTVIKTLKNKLKNKYVLPRTVLKAVADDNGNYLDNGLSASDVNILKNGKISSMVTDISNNTSAINAINNKLGGFTIRRGYVYNTTVTIDNVVEGILFIMRPEYNMGSTYYVRGTEVFTHYAQGGLVVAKPTTYTLTITESNDTTRFYILLSRT